MVALDNSAIFGSDHKVPRLKLTLGPLVGGIALLAAALVLGAVVARGFGENGLRLGSQLAWRYVCLVFFAALSSGPVCRIASRVFQTPCPESLSRKLVWGFCASYAVYLLSVFLPNVIQLSAGATLMVLFGGSVAAIMAGTVAPIRLNGRVLIGDKTRRAMLAIATMYFWLCYALMALARISGPHRPDVWYGFSLSLMVAALLLRYADRWFGHRAQTQPLAV
ncbi:MAG: hypothetical protein JWN16_2450 [Alphaproteobacteria bacterium]|nr:hypothetical protein [Alphaproteobacteria bacterium]